MAQKIKPKVRPKKEVNLKARAQIIQAATKLFSEQGLEATTTRQIAAASGLNISLISYYFAGKVGLYQTIIYEHALKIKTNLDSVLEKHSHEKFTAQVFKNETTSIVRQMVELRLSNAAMSKIFMAERTQKMPYAREVFENLMKSTTDKMVNMIEEGQKQGFLRSDFPASVFLILMIESILGYFMVQDCQLKVWRQTYQLPKDKEKFIQFVSHIFTQGILL